MDHENVVSRDRWSLVAGSVSLICVLLRKNVVFFRTGGLLWQWSVKTDFTLLVKASWTSL